jgi:hypothetical protein
MRGSYADEVIFGLHFLKNHPYSMALVGDMNEQPDDPVCSLDNLVEDWE